MIYYENNDIVIRPMKKSDIEHLSDEFINDDDLNLFFVKQLVD